MKIDSEIASEMLYANVGDEMDGWVKAGDEEGVDRRWSRTVTTVVQHVSGDYYAFNWEHGLTESQENEYPWQVWDGDDLPEIELFPVEKSTRTIVTWEAR